MSTKLSPTQEELVEALYRLPDNMKAEIIDGAIVPMSPTGGKPSRISGLIFAALLAYEQNIEGGIALPNNVGYIVNLPNRGSFSPDASFWIGEMLDYKFINGTPLFAAEVRSENDYGPAAERAIRRKIADYFAAGTQVVWDVDAKVNQLICVYRDTDADNPTVYGLDDEAEAEPALPGWHISLRKLLR